jgi:hypothetical protein
VLETSLNPFYKEFAMKKSLFGLFFVGLLVAVSVYSLVSVGDAFPGKPVTSGELGEVVAADVTRKGSLTGAKQCTGIVRSAYATCSLNAAGTSCIGLNLPKSNVKTNAKDEMSCSGDTTKTQHLTESVTCGSVTFRYCRYYKPFLSSSYTCGLSPITMQLTVPSTEYYTVCKDFTTPLSEP